MKNKGIIAVALIVVCSHVVSCGSTSSDGASTTSCKNYLGTATCSDVWTELSPTGTLPAKRYLTDAAYDAAGDNLLLFGGTNDTTYYNDAFVLSNASGDAASAWTTLSPTGTAPAGRGDAAVAYKSSTNKLIVYGGADASTIKTDLFILSDANGSGTPAWSNPTLSGTAPTNARAHFASAYDETNDILMLFGGKYCSSSSCTLLNEVWTITAVTTAPTWSQLSPSGTAPSARSYASAVYDATQNRLLIFGGNTSTALNMAASSAQSDTWVLSNANGSGGTPAWSKLSPSTTPGEHSGHSAVYDSTNDRMIVFGGINASNSALDETWILADSRTGSPSWIRYVTCAPIPTAREYHTALYTGSTSNRMTIFGGMIGGGTKMNDTWVLNNANALFATNASSVTVTSSSAEICTTNTTQLEVGAFDSSGNALSNFVYTCTSSDTSVATVDSEGLVTAVGVGTATITVTVNDISKTFVVTVISSGDGDSGSENWSGTFELIDVFKGVYECTYTTTGKISLSITKDGSTLDGTNRFTNLQETSTPEAGFENLACPPNVHSSKGTLAGSVDSNGNYAFTFFDLDYIQAAPFTATISGNNLSASFTQQSTGSVASDTYTITITATKQ